MFGSSSTTSSRASGLRAPDADGLVLVADTTPPDEPCTGAVVMLRGSGVRLHLGWTLPVRRLGVLSRCGAPVAVSRRRSSAGFRAPVRSSLAIATGRLRGRSAPRSLALAAMLTP